MYVYTLTIPYLSMCSRDTIIAPCSLLNKRVLPRGNTLYCASIMARSALTGVGLEPFKQVRWLDHAIVFHFTTVCFLRCLKQAKPANPVPKRSMVAGSGTGVVPK